MNWIKRFAVLAGALAAAASVLVGIGSAVAAAAPANTSLPSISGSARDGSLLTASHGSWTGSPTSYAYAWQRCDTDGGACAPISGATSRQYTAASADVGHRLRVVVTATNSTGSGTATSRATNIVAATGQAPKNTSAPAISGTVKEGSTLTVDKGGWTGTNPITYAYAWQRCDATGGNRYHKKKNRISYFTGKHDYLVEEYGERYLDGCLGLAEEWSRVHAGIESPSMLLEAEATREALGMADQLGLAGLVVLVAGEVKAFTLGEQLNRETSVCQFEKADPFLDGLYQLINREFSRRLFTDCGYVNREQDLGEPNLRESKLSYHPVELVKKYRIRKKG
jgi:hypothetical protein